MSARDALRRKAFDARAQVRERMARRVRYWVFGTEANFPGDPRRQLTMDRTSWAPMRLIQFTPGESAPVTIGKYTGIHHTVAVFQGGLHHLDWVGIQHLQRIDGELAMPDGVVYTNGPVVFGSDVWVAFEAVVMSGVTIGDGAVVAARAVVTKSVEPYEIVGGNPAKHIRWRFDEETRAAMLRIRWWDWSEEKVQAHRAEIDSPDVAGFIARHDPLLHPDGHGEG